MAAITVEQRAELVALFLTMFGQAPTTTQLARMVTAREAGASLLNIATSASVILEDEFALVASMDAESFGTYLTNALLASDIPAEAREWAHNWVVTQVSGTRSKVDVLVEAVQAIRTTTNPNYASSQAELEADVTATLDAIDHPIVTGQVYTLTTTVDNIVGSTANDVINANVTATSAVLGGLDVVDGGSGTDTLNIADTSVAANADFSIPAGFTVKNVENLSVTTNGALGTKGGAQFDISGMTGLTSATLVAAGAGTAAGSNIKAANTTDVTLTVAGNNQVDIAGGKAVSVVSGATGTGTVGVVGSGLTSVTVKGGGVANIDNTSAGGTTSVGTTMTTVTLDAIAGATATIGGGAIANLNLQNQATPLAVTMTNATSTALNVNTNGVGYTAAGATVAVSVAAGAAATTVNVNATGSKSNLTVTAAAAKTLNITGDAALTLAPIASVTKVDGSAATGALTLGTLAAGTVNVTTGSGNDIFTANTTNKLTVNSGAGNDAVTLSGALVVGSTVNLGAGNDKLIGTTPVLKAGAGLTDSVIDGGDGTDTVSAALINAGNAALFTNFEGLSLNSTTGLDAALLTGSTLTALSIDSASTNALYQNLSVSQVLEVSYVGTNAVTNTLSFKDATGTSDTFAIKFVANNTGATPTAANVDTGTIAAAGIENFTIASGGTKAWNSMDLTGAQAKTVTITGAANLDLGFAAFGTAGAGGVNSIDGSAATGKLAIDVAGVGAATAGLTVKGGTAADTLIASTFAVTLTGGAGNDSFVVAAAVAKDVTDPTKVVVTTITDATVGDKIVFADLGTEVFTSTQVDVSTATALIGGTTNAYDLAIAAATGGTDGQITWFQYGGNTYIVEELGADAAVIGADDIVVKLTGLVDLSTASYDAATNTLTLA